MKELFELAEERGYPKLNMFNPSGWYAFAHKQYPITLEVFSDGKFCLTHLVKHSTITVSTGSCSPFSNNEHFQRIEQSFLEVVDKLTE